MLLLTVIFGDLVVMTSGCGGLLNDDVVVTRLAVRWWVSCWLSIWYATASVMIEDAITKATWDLGEHLQPM